MIKTYIERNQYIPKIKPFLNKDVIKVITGQRRVGKSYLLYQIMDMVKRLTPKDRRIIYINKELHEFDTIKDYNDLLKYILQKSKDKKKKFVFIDEIQEIKQFEKALRSLQVKGEYDIYCTGSNADLLSGELASYLSGRYIEIKVFGLSYTEFLYFHKLQNSSDSFLKYIRYGGLPYLVNLKLEDDIVYEYLRTICETILLKDIVARYGARNINFLERLVEFLADNIGSIVSAKRISDFLKSQQINISPNIILNYLSFLASAFLIFKVSRANVLGKKIFEIGEKYYFEDLGIRHALIGYRHNDINKILENLVFLHLKMAGYKVNVGKLADREIDFVCDKSGDRLYVQVVYLLKDEHTRLREFGNLLAINDNYPKIVVSMDEIAGGKFKGIEQVNIRDFLLQSG